MSTRKKMREIQVPKGEGKFKKAELKAAVEKVKNMSREQVKSYQTVSKVIHLQPNR